MLKAEILEMAVWRQEVSCGLCLGRIFCVKDVLFKRVYIKHPVLKERKKKTHMTTMDKFLVLY